MVGSAVSELVSLGAVMPFLSVLAEPKNLLTLEWLSNMSVFARISSADQMILVVTILFVLASIISALIRLMTLRYGFYLSASIGSDLSKEVFCRTLYQPYEIHVQRDSSVLITAVTVQLGRSVNAFNNLLQLATALMVSISLISGMFIINPKIALVSIIYFSLLYGCIIIITKNLLQSNSIKISRSTTIQLRILRESLGAIRDVILDRNQLNYITAYSKQDIRQRYYVAQNQYLGAFPRYIMEAIGISSIVIYGGLLLIQTTDSTQIIPLLGALALGAQRLLPSLQQIFRSWALIKGSNADLNALLDLLKQEYIAPTLDINPYILKKSFQFNSVSFAYSESSVPILNNVNLTINKGDCIGLVGPTGSGKSTTVDLIMGLISPTSGKILVDQKCINSQESFALIESWRASISHVPQNIFLFNCSIAENIALGIPYEKIDYERLDIATKAAQIYSVISDMPNGYKTIVGEQGIKLSGGQKQRIGIARALYKQSNIIILDEATSALDQITEQSFMNTIHNLNNDYTIIIIAHRLSTLANCNRLIRIESGKIKDVSKSNSILRQIQNENNYKFK